jgi:hypothetical protein
METPSPYQSPQSHMSPQPPPGLPDVMVREPGAIKTFGVIHLIMAGYGIIMGLFSLLSTLFFQNFSKSFATPSGTSGPSSTEQEMAMTNYMSDLQFYTYISIAFTFVLAAMLIIAGIGLLKAREKGRVMSIRYAWTSIATKVVALIYTIVVVMPATKRMTDTMYQGMPGGMSNTMGSIMQYSQIFGILITLAYPILVLVMMKGEKVKAYLAGR